MLAVTFSLSLSHRLYHEGDNEREKNGIQWTLSEQLDDLDFADDLALLAHNQNQMQDKICR